MPISKPGSKWESGQERAFQAGKKNHVQSQRRVEKIMYLEKYMLIAFTKIKPIM